MTQRSRTDAQGKATQISPQRSEIGTTVCLRTLQHRQRITHVGVHRTQGDGGRRTAPGVLAYVSQGWLDSELHVRRHPPHSQARPTRPHFLTRLCCQAIPLSSPFGHPCDPFLPSLPVPDIDHCGGSKGHRGRGRLRTSFAQAKAHHTRIHSTPSTNHSPVTRNTRALSHSFALGTSHLNAPASPPSPEEVVLWQGVGWGLVSRHFSFLHVFFHAPTPPPASGPNRGPPPCFAHTLFEFRCLCSMQSCAVCPFMWKRCCGCSWRLH